MPHLYLNLLMKRDRFPKQARDKHKKSTEKTTVLSAFLPGIRSCALDIQNMQREQEMGIPVLVRGEGGWALSARTKTPPIQGAKFEFDFHAAAWAVASSDTTPSWFTRYHFGYADVAFSWNPRFETVLGKSKAEMKALDGYSFSREFEHYTVIVNCTTQEGSFVKRR